MLTLIDEDRELEVPVRVDRGRAWIPREAVAAGLRLGPGPEEVDLTDLAATLDRPLALDVEEGAAYLGVSAGCRGAALLSLRAPDFELPDLDGRRHALSAQRGKKVLLVAHASW